MSDKNDKGFSPHPDLLWFTTFERGDCRIVRNIDYKYVKISVGNTSIALKDKEFESLCAALHEVYMKDARDMMNKLITDQLSGENAPIGHMMSLPLHLSDEDKAKLRDDLQDTSQSPIGPEDIYFDERDINKDND